MNRSRLRQLAADVEADPRSVTTVMTGDAAVGVHVLRSEYLEPFVLLSNSSCARAHVQMCS